MGLPSERFRVGDPRPAGFQVELNDAQVSATVAALGEIAEEANMPDRGGPQLRICLTSVGWTPGLPFNLYAFAIHDVDRDGHVTTDAAVDEVRYAILANQPVDLQREIAITSLFQLIGRQTLVANAVSDRRVFTALPDRAADADQERRAAAGQELRGNWRTAIASLHAEAEAGGVSIRARYEPDPLPRRDDIVRRLPALRRAYDELELARDAIDRAAAMLSQQPWRIVGGEERARRAAQERLETMQFTRYLSQAARDGYVCGNGYVRFGGEAGEARVRTLRPEQVEIRGGRYIERSPAGDRDVTEGTVPVTGFGQLHSPYGVSALELALHALRVLDLQREMGERHAALRRRGLLIDQLRTLDDDEAIVERMFSDALEALRPMYQFFLSLPAPPPDLYFPGQERLS
jgi:hypothetical protein